MNLGTSLAVYASICKHLDVPFVFPGAAAAQHVFTDATDADLLAEHLIWEATDPKCANQVRREGRGGEGRGGEERKTQAKIA